MQNDENLELQGTTALGVVHAWLQAKACKQEHDSHIQNITGF